MQEKEIWKAIEGYEGYYQVSNFGRVKSLDRYVPYKLGKEALKKGIIRKLTPDKDGYLKVVLRKSPKYTYIGVHRLVLLAFKQNPKNKPEVNHIDGVKTNNHVDNLEWVTSRENQLHAFKIGLQISAKGIEHPHSKLKREDIIGIRNMSKKGIRNYIIASHYKVSQSCICKILKKYAWKHIK